MTPKPLPRTRSEALAAAWKGRTVLVVGDVMLDRYLWGSVERISPEAPVPVLSVEEESFRLGGAANVANTIAGLGARPRLVSVVGADEDAQALRERLREHGLPVDGLIEDPARPTTVKTRIVAKSHHLVRFDRESRAEIEGGAVSGLLEVLEQGIAVASAIVISDYGKGMITPAVLEPLLGWAQANRVPVCVDPKDTHFFSYRGVSVVTPNQHEAAEVLGYKLRDEASVDRAGRELLERLDARAVLITRGASGMSLFETDGGRRTDFPALARQVYDVTGAGDTVVGTYAAALAGGAEPVEAAELANRAAGDVVQHVGTAVPSRDSLMEAPGS